MWDEIVICFLTLNVEADFVTGIHFNINTFTLILDGPKKNFFYHFLTLFKINVIPTDKHTQKFRSVIC